MARDQELSVKITGDASDLQKAAGDASKALDGLQKEVKAVDSESIQITADVELGRINRDMANLKKALDDIEHQKVDPEVDMDLTQLLKDEAKVRKAMDDLEKRKVQIEVDVETTGEVDVGGFQKTSLQTAALTAGFEEMGDELGNLTGLIGGVGAGFAGWGLVKAAADVETTKISLASLTGSAEEGAAAFKDLQKFAATTPYELDQVTTAARSLLAAGVEANELPDMLTDIGNAASAVSAPLDEVALVFQQMFAKGKISNEELLQLAERQVPAYQALADAMGVTTADIQKMAEKGELGADKINLLSEALGDMFPTSMEDQANSLNGQLSTLGDNVTQLAGNIGAVLLPPVKDLVGALNDILGPLADFTAKFEELPGPVKEAAENFTAIATVVGGAAFFGPKVVGAIVAVKGAVDALGVSAIATSGKLRLLGTGLYVGAVVVGIQTLQNALNDLFNVNYDSSNADRELTNLANTGKASGEIAKTFGKDLEGVGKSLRVVESGFMQAQQKAFGIFPGKTSLDTAKDRIDELDKALADLVESGNAEEAAKAYQKIVDAAKEQGVSTGQVKKNFDEYTVAVNNATEADKKEASEAERLVRAHIDAAEAAKEHEQHLEDLGKSAEAATEKYTKLRDAFTVVNQGFVDSRSAIYDYQGALDTLAESLGKGTTFSPDLEQGRSNWDALVNVANGAAAVVESTWKTKGAKAAVAVAEQQRKSMANMLIDAGVKAPRAWGLVNQVFKTPVKIKIELDQIALAKAQAALRKARADAAAARDVVKGKQTEALADPKTAGTQAARDVAAGFAEQYKPIDAKVRAAATNVKEAKEELNGVANPNGKNRKAGIKADVQGETAAKTTLDNLAVDRYAYIYTRVRPAPEGAPGAPPQAAPRLAAMLNPLAGLQAAGAAMAAPTALPYYAPRPSGAPPSQPGGTTVRMAPRQTPVQVLLDGAVIADHLDARRSMAAVESIRRTA